MNLKRITSIVLTKKTGVIALGLFGAVSLSITLFQITKSQDIRQRASAPQEEVIFHANREVCSADRTHMPLFGVSPEESFSALEDAGLFYEGDISIESAIKDILLYQTTVLAGAITQIERAREIPYATIIGGNGGKYYVFDVRGRGDIFDAATYSYDEAVKISNGMRSAVVYYELFDLPGLSDADLISLNKMINVNGSFQEAASTINRMGELLDLRNGDVAKLILEAEGGTNELFTHYSKLTPTGTIEVRLINGNILKFNQVSDYVGWANELEKTVNELGKTKFITNAEILSSTPLKFTLPGSGKLMRALAIAGKASFALDVLFEAVRPSGYEIFWGCGNDPRRALRVVVNKELKSMRLEGALCAEGSVCSVTSNACITCVPETLLPTVVEVSPICESISLDQVCASTNGCFWYAGYSGEPSGCRTGNRGAQCGGLYGACYSPDDDSNQICYYNQYCANQYHLGLGQSCASSNQCASQHCTNGVCSAAPKPACPIGAASNYQYTCAGPVCPGGTETSSAFSCNAGSVCCMKKFCSDDQVSYTCSGKSIVYTSVFGNNGTAATCDSGSICKNAGNCASCVKCPYGTVNNGTACAPAPPVTGNTPVDVCANPDPATCEGQCGKLWNDGKCINRNSLSVGDYCTQNLVCGSENCSGNVCCPPDTTWDSATGVCKVISLCPVVESNGTSNYCSIGACSTGSTEKVSGSAACQNALGNSTSRCCNISPASDCPASEYVCQASVCGSAGGNATGNAACARAYGNEANYCCNRVQGDSEDQIGATPTRIPTTILSVSPTRAITPTKTPIPTATPTPTRLPTPTPTPCLSPNSLCGGPGGNCCYGYVCSNLSSSDGRNRCIKNVIYDDGGVTSGKISGRVFFDANNNNRFDTSEIVFRNITLEARAVSGSTTVRKAITDSQGLYAMSIPFGSYRVKTNLPAGYASLSNDMQVSLNSISTTATRNFGLSKLTCGDINRDGVVGVTDALLQLRHTAGLTIISSDMIAYADVDGNGTINLSDTLQMRKYIGGLLRQTDLKCKLTN